jgi:phosphonate transport system substrate-binding protein
LKGGEHMNKEKGISSIIIISVIVIIVLFAGIGWYFYSKNSTQKQVTQQTDVTQPTTEKGVLRVGEDIDEDGLAADKKEFQPFIDYLVSKLSAQGYTRGEFVGTNSVSEMSQLVREGKVDIMIDSAFPVYVVGKLAGAQPIANRWKTGVETYHSAIFVKQNSPIKTLDDLKGKMLAFDSLTSTVGYFLPKAELIKLGYTLTQKNKPTDPCPATQICYTLVHGSVYESVANGVVPAGAESELEIDGYFGAKIKDYRIISKSPDIYRFLVATRGDMDPTLQSAIKNILFTMDGTQEGRTVLQSFADTAKFTTIASGDAAYGILKDLTSLVEDEIVRQ